MGFSPSDRAFWLATLLAESVLFGILISRKRAGRFPCFTAYIAFDLLISLVVGTMHAYGSQAAYFWTYWGMGIVQVLLQVGIVFEIAGEVLKPAGTWSRDAKAMFLGIGTVGALLAAGLSFAVDPKLGSGAYAWSARFDLFASLLIAELVVAMFITSDRMGLQWRNWVMCLGEGLGIWVGVSLLVDIVHSYVGWTQSYRPLDRLSIGVYLIVIAYWCVSFWKEEPQRKQLSPEMREYFSLLNKYLTYDLTSLGRIRK